MAELTAIMYTLEAVLFMRSLIVIVLILDIINSMGLWESSLGSIMSVQFTYMLPQKSLIINRTRASKPIG